MRSRPEGGSAAIELTLVAPVLVVLLLFVVFVGRLAEARAEVDRAARDGARAASLARNGPQASDDGRRSVENALQGHSVTCQHLGVDVDTSGFTAGGWVQATVSCSVDLADLTLLRVPGTRTLTATFRQPVDTYRGLDR